MNKPKTKERTFDPTVAAEAAQRALTDATELRTTLLADLAAGADVRAELQEVEIEIAAHEQTIKQFGEARAVAAKANTAGAKVAAHERTLARLVDGVVGAEQLAEQCKNALLVLADLKGCLEQIDNQRAAVSACLHDVARDACHGAPSERVAQDMHEQLQSVVAALTLPDAFVLGICESGLGRRGVVISDDFLEVRRPMQDTQSDPVADAESALIRLRGLAERVAEWSANTNGVKAA